jgi:AcrR family transcriptional regulator
MSSSYEHSGRTRQKQRTSAALIAAARELIAQGHTPTVEDTAVAADISRTTAYRYFPNQAALLVASHPEMEARSLLPPNPPADAEARLEVVVREFTALIAATEAQQRATLRLSLQADPTGEGGLPLRQGRAIGWIAEALSPLRESVPDEELDRLVLAIRSAIGIEALVWLTDVAGLSRAQAADLMRWSAAAMLHAVICANSDRVGATNS